MLNWPRVCPSVCHKSGVLLKRLNVGPLLSRKQRQMITSKLKFFDDGDLAQIPTGSPPTELIH